MIIKVTISCVKILTLLSTFLTQYQSKIKKVDLATLYGSQALVETDRYQFSVGPTDMTHASAQKYCTLEQTSLLTVRPEMDLKKMLATFDKPNAWTSLYRLTKNPLLVDDKAVTPILQTTLGEIIKISDIDMDEVLTKGITLDKTTTGLKYTAADKTELKPVICMKYVEFPYRQMDRTSFDIIQTNMLNQVTQKRLWVDRIKNDIARREKQVEILTNSSVLIIDHAVDLGNQIETTLKTLAILSDQIVLLFSTLKGEADLHALGTGHVTLLESLVNLVLDASSVFEDPLSLVSEALLSTLNQNRLPTQTFYRSVAETSEDFEDNIFLAIDQSFFEKLKMPLKTPDIIEGFFRLEKFFQISIADIILFSIDCLMVSGLICSCF